MSNFEFYKLTNGVRVILVPMMGVESVAVGVYIGAGTREETWETNGVAHFLEHMAFKGTKKFPSRKDTSIVEGQGAIQNGWTDSEATSYWAKLPADKWKLGLEVQKELVMHPLLRAGDLEKERGVILEEIHRRDDDASEKVGEMFYHMLYPQESLGWSTLGRAEVIKTIDQEAFVKFHNKHYTAGNIVVAVAGKLDKDLVSTIERWFGEMLVSKKVAREKPTEMLGPRVEIATKNEAQQMHLELGMTTFDMHDSRRFALAVLNRIMGYGLSGRLFMNVREKKGLAYEIGSSYELFGDHGGWSAHAGVAPDKLELAVKAILEELAKLRQVKVDKKELEEAKEKIRGPLVFEQENPYYQMENYAHQALWRPENIVTYKQVEEQVMQVTAEDIINVAKDVFVREKLNLAVVGPLGQKDKDRLGKILAAW